ncbi:hypothetical protein T265_11737 [Opisthorchis viverrini]|uniref:Uncharacterized protein n=1 Tax=Opisthorchis viverrini TaxID=6198 RepID=A0A074YXW3_OPIVI|nr:hypothetical protein T265_11737 [Opisthorchis viverrini]KER19508.1 hypothetical protein T265_11737 [Opisthorchis viverrini]
MELAWLLEEQSCAQHCSALFHSIVFSVALRQGHKAGGDSQVPAFIVAVTIRYTNATIPQWNCGNLRSIACPHDDE